MKNLLYLIICITFSFGASAQTEMIETYCMITGVQVPFKNKIEIKIDFGERVNGWKPREAILRDKFGKTYKFNSMVDALNFMSLKGWKFVDAYTFSSENNRLSHNWIMKKMVPINEIGPR